MKYLIVARNLTQAKAWARNNRVPFKSCKYASNAESIMGISDRAVVFLDGSEMHRDAARIKNLINQVIITGHVQLINEASG